MAQIEYTLTQWTVTLLQQYNVLQEGVVGARSSPSGPLSV